MTKLTNLLYFVVIFLLPIPVFYDFFFREILIGESPFYIDPVIPLHLGFLLYTGSIPILLFNSRLDFLIPTKKFIFVIFVSFIFLIISATVSALPIIRGVQLLAFVIPFLALGTFRNHWDRLILKKIIILSPILFASLHFFSLLIYSGDLPKIARDEYVMFHGYEIYQSLVVYPSVLGIYALLVLFEIFEGDGGWVWKFCLCFFYFVILFVCLASHRRAILVQIFTQYFLMMAWYLYAVLKSRKKIIFLKLIKVILFLCLSASASIFIYFISGFSGRIDGQGALGNSDGGRLSIWLHGLHYIFSDVFSFLFGNMQGNIPGFHNYLLDTWARVGLVGVTLLLLVAFMLMYFTHARYKALPLKASVTAFLFILCAMVAIDSFINSAFTQPYYLGNLLAGVIFFLNYFKNEADNGKY